MTEQEIKSEMRLWAIEILAANSFAILLALDATPDETFEKIHRQMIEGAGKRTFPGFDPAMSDHFSAELQGALDRLMGMVGVQMRLGRGTAG